MAFDPDEYLQGGTTTNGFDPDAYLASTPTPTPAATEVVAPSLVERIKSFAEKPSPPWLQAPEQAVRQIVGEMIPTDVPSYLRMVYPPAAAFEQGQALAQGDVSSIPLVGRVPEIMKAEETPAFSKERYMAGIRTLLDVSALAGAGVKRPPLATRIKAMPPEVPLAERITQPRVEPPVTPEVVQPQGIFKESDITGPHINQKAVDAMAQAYREGNPAILERPIAVTQDEAGGFNIVEGHNRAAAATVAGVDPPIAIFKPQELEGLNAPEVDAAARRRFAEQRAAAPPEAPPVPEAAPPPPTAGEVPVRHGEFAQPGYTAVETAPEPYTPEAAAARAAEQPSGAGPLPLVAEPAVPVPEGGPRVTSTKNAVVDAERVARGLPPILSQASGDFPKLVADAEARVAENPRYPDVLVTELSTGARTALDPVDEAVLLTRKVELQNAKAKVGDRALDPALPEGERADARVEFEDLEAQLNTMDEATRRGGTLWSEQGRFRQQLMAEDYSLQAMEQRMRIAKGGQPLTPEESATLRTRTTKMADLQARIMARNERLELAIAQRKGLAPPRGARELLPGDVETEALQTELARLKAAQREAGRLPQAKIQTQKRIDILEKRMAEYGFAKPPKHEPVVADPELRRLQYDLANTKADLDRGIFHEKLKHRTRAERIWQTGREVLALPRALMASMDLSAIRRQGGMLFMGNPIRSLRIMPDMLKAARSDRGYWEGMQEIRERPNAPLYQSSKLGLTDIEAPKLSQLEEQYMSRWANAIPLISHSQRAYVYFLNRLRADTFDTMAKTLGRNGEVTVKQADGLSNFINVFTGRGRIPEHYQNAAAALNDLFFAPRYVISRFQALTGQPLRYAKDPAVRKLIAKEYAKTLIGYGVMYGLVGTALKQFADVEWDPRSTDFGKIKVGNTRIDMLSGLSQPTVFMSRLFSGKTKTQSGEIRKIYGDIPYGQTSASDVITRFLRSKLAPVPAAAWNWFEGKKVTGEPVTLPQQAADLVTPMSGNDIYEAMKEWGVPKGAALGLLSFFGDSVQTYSPRLPPQQIGPKTLQQQIRELQRAQGVTPMRPKTLKEQLREATGGG